MTKTLTEQWREGGLPNGDYYIKVRGRLTKKDFYAKDNCINGKWAYTLDGNVIDIIEQVPSYEEYNDLIQQNVNQESAIETYIERIKELEEMFDSAVDALYEYIKMYGVERECSKFLEKYAERVK